MNCERCSSVVGGVKTWVPETPPAFLSGLLLARRAERIEEEQTFCRVQTLGSPGKLAWTKTVIISIEIIKDKIGRSFDMRYENEICEVHGYSNTPIRGGRRILSLVAVLQPYGSRFRGGLKVLLKFFRCFGEGLDYSNFRTPCKIQKIRK